MRITLLILLCGMMALPACSTKREDLKSPCVGADDSPCGPRRPVNTWLT